MTWRPLQPCIRCGAPHRAGGLCESCRATKDQRRAKLIQPKPGEDYNDRRPEEHKFYGTAAWKRLRKAFLSANPLCELHLEKGETVPAQVVDHRIPVRERWDLRMDQSNLRALCHSCHNRYGRKVGRKVIDCR